MNKCCILRASESCRLPLRGRRFLLRFMMMMATMMTNNRPAAVDRAAASPPVSRARGRPPAGSWERRRRTGRTTGAAARSVARRARLWVRSKAPLRDNASPGPCSLHRFLVHRGTTLAQRGKTLQRNFSNEEISHYKISFVRYSQFYAHTNFRFLLTRRSRDYYIKLMCISLLFVVGAPIMHVPTLSVCMWSVRAL